MLKHEPREWAREGPLARTSTCNAFETRSARRHLVKTIDEFRSVDMGRR